MFRRYRNIPVLPCERRGCVRSRFCIGRDKRIRQAHGLGGVSPVCPRFPTIEPVVVTPVTVVTVTATADPVPTSVAEDTLLTVSGGSGAAGPNIALGARISGLRTFARDIGAEHLLDIPSDQWKSVFLSYVQNPSAKFNVSMAGFYGDTPEAMILNELQSGSNTGWELQQLQQAGRLSEVNFYQPGQSAPIPNPFSK